MVIAAKYTSQNRCATIDRMNEKRNGNPGNERDENDVNALALNLMDYATHTALT